MDIHTGLSSKRNSWIARLGLIAALTVLPACSSRDGAKDAGPPVAVICYGQMERQSPGVYGFHGKLNCSAATERVRVQGPRDRPAAIDLLDGTGRVRLEYRVRYAKNGRPIEELRVFHTKPPSYSVHDRGERIQFDPPANLGWQGVRILTLIDEQGRAVQMEKRVGDKLEFRVVRRFGSGGLERESTFDGKGRLKNEIVFDFRNGKRFEVMRDGAGKILLEREQPAALDGGSGIQGSERLDTSGPGRVQPRQ